MSIRRLPHPTIRSFYSNSRLLAKKQTAVHENKQGRASNHTCLGSLALSTTIQDRRANGPSNIAEQKKASKANGTAADVLNLWQDIFEAHKINFSAYEDALYTPAITLWALFSQAFFKGDLDQDDVVADLHTTPTSRRILLVEGFSVTAADTPENQEEFPQNPSQKRNSDLHLFELCV